MLDLAGTPVGVLSYVAYKQNSTQVLSVGKVVKLFEPTLECLVRTLDISIINSKPILVDRRVTIHNFVVIPEPSFLIQDWLSNNYVFDKETAKLVRDWLNTGKFPFEDTKQEYNREN